MSASVGLFIDPLSPQLERDALFDLDANPYGGEQINAPWVQLKDHLAGCGVAVHTADLLARREREFEINLYVSMGTHERWPELQKRADVVLSAYFTNECPIVEPSLFTGLHRAAAAFRRVYSYSDADALRPFLREPIGGIIDYRWPQSFDVVDDELWRRTDRGFAAMINTNKLPRLFVHELYTERLRAIEFFGRTGTIDLYGRGWDGPAFRTGRTWAPATVRRVARRTRRVWEGAHHDPLLRAARRVHRGPVHSKAETLSAYHYAICFENMILRGWITEKIFDCFYVGTIPVYLGAPDIERWVPRECFIDMRDFGDYGELAQHLGSIDERDRATYRDAARAFIASERFDPFRRRTFTERFAAMVEQDAGTRVGSTGAP